MLLISFSDLRNWEDYICGILRHLDCKIKPKNKIADEGPAYSISSSGNFHLLSTETHMTDIST